jgi:hypothetical protein
LEGEVELLDRLAGGKAGGLDAGLAAVAVAAVGLGLEQRASSPVSKATAVTARGSTRTSMRRPTSAGFRL